MQASTSRLVGFWWMRRLPRSSNLKCLTTLVLLLALLKNSELRAEHAVQRKLDAIAAAILEQREGKTSDAHAALEEAIGMHEEV